LGNKEIRTLIQKQEHKSYLFNCRDELLSLHCDPKTCPIKQIDDKYIPVVSGADIANRIDVLITTIPEKEPEIPISLENLSNKMWGLRRGELTVIGGFASYGKSALLNQFILDSIRRQKRVLLFSSESSSDEVINRLLSNELSIDSWQFRRFNFTEKNKKTLEAYKVTVHDWPLSICDKACPTIEDIEFGIRRLQPDIVFIDYIQRCVSGHDMYEQLKDWMVSLKSFAKIYDIAVIAASQVGRASKQEGASPGLHHLHGSSSIEQEANNCIILDRKDGQDDTSEVIITAHLCKGKDIGTGKFILKLNTDYLRFTEMPKDGQMKPQEIPT
jgi:replicative DNA helicase